MPVFDENKNIIGLTAAPLNSLHQQTMKLIKEEGVDLQDTVKIITSNAADSLKLKGKSHLINGYDADIVLLDDN